MANQITIDIGAAANDGTGDPLRTAFNYVNNNFSNVWLTGLPTSNVQFSDNRILTVNTNANLVLAPNGIGKVASNVDIVPNTANVFNLGGTTRRWNTVYGQFLNLSHNATIGGNLVVTGNITGGNISYTGNVFIGDLEGSVFDGASSLVLDVINSSIYVDNYYYANGTPVSFGGNYSNANVAAYLPTYTGNLSANNISAGNVFTAQTVTATNIYAKTGTFSGDENTGDASMYVGSPTFTQLGTDIMAQFTGNVATYGQLNFQNYSNSATATGDYIITADNGNDSTHFLDLGMTSSTWDGTQDNSLGNLLTPNNGYLYVQDGNLTLGTKVGSAAGNVWTFDTTGNLTLPVNGDLIVNGGEIIQAPDNNLIIRVQDADDDGYSLDLVVDDGAEAQQTRVLLNRGAVEISLDMQGVGYDWSFNDNGVFDLAGNISGVYGSNNSFYAYDDGANGSVELKTISYLGDTLGSNVRVTQSNATISTANATNTWTFDNTGNLTVPGNVTFADNYVYSGNTFTSPETNGILKNFKWEFSDLSSGADTVTLQWNLLDTTFPQWYLTTNSQGNTYVFDGDAKTIGFLDNSVNSGTVTFGTAANNGAGGSNDIELTTVTGNAYVRTGSNSWQFGDDGVLTAPGNITTTGNVSGGNILGNGASMTGVVTKSTGTWTVTSGTNTYSFTVPVNGVYQLWVNGNIANGIIAYNATVSVTNSNVPVIGQQFAWNYEGAGNPILITSIPAQIIGTAGAISNASPSVGTTTNTFDFDINNSSGGDVTVYWGYTKIS